MKNYIEELSRDFCLRFDLEDYVTVCTCDITYQYKYDGVTLTASVTNGTAPISYLWECIENGYTSNENFPNNGTSLIILNSTTQTATVNNFPVNKDVKFRCTIVDAKGNIKVEEIIVFKSGTTSKTNCDSTTVPYVN